MKRSLLAKLIAIANNQRAVDFGILPSVGFSDCHPFTIDGYFDYMSIYLPSSVEMFTERMKDKFIPTNRGKCVVACASSMLNINKVSRTTPKFSHRKLNRTQRGGKRCVKLNDWHLNPWEV